MKGYSFSEVQEPSASTPDRRVFVIDDEAAFCLFMSRLVGGLGYEVTTTSHIKSLDLGELTKRMFCSAI